MRLCSYEPVAGLRADPADVARMVVATHPKHRIHLLRLVGGRVHHGDKQVARDGGSPPRSEPREAQSQHGFLGIETEALDKIARFIVSHSR